MQSFDSQSIEHLKYKTQEAVAAIASGSDSFRVPLPQSFHSPESIQSQS